jgi:hypothetical protein
MESWRKEFYPITGKEAAKQGTLASLKHGLKKWQGVMVENRNKHNIFRVDSYWLQERDQGQEVIQSFQLGWRQSFQLGWRQCGLCWIYDETEGPLGQGCCEGCPISRPGENGERITCLDRESGYYKFIHGQAGPEILIEELTQALEDWQAKYGDTVTEENKYGSDRIANPDWAEKAPIG